ncbi:VOC family protein [Streptomyces sp. NPDC058665]|uniref:VOC family protein n=1 Tax=Streptomyces sp. NPDC058665 TaxID=3346586 RepID=UPI00365CE664
MSVLSTNQPEGTPTWMELRTPDRKGALAFYQALFGWEYEPYPTGDAGGTVCLLHGRPVAGIVPDTDRTTAVWTMYFATDDCDDTARRVTETGGRLIEAPADLADHARTAVAVDAVGARFGLWQGRSRLGSEIVNEPDSLVRNDLITPDPGPARAFYTALFGFMLDGNDEVPELDFTFLRRPDGHEIGGIIGSPNVPTSAWGTLFAVSDADAVAERATASGGSSTEPEDTPYARMATVTDPAGAVFSVGKAP